MTEQDQQGPEQALPDEQPETRPDGGNGPSDNANGVDHEDEEAGEHGVVTSNPADLPATKKKKKKKKRPQGQRGLVSSAAQVVTVKSSHLVCRTSRREWKNSMLMRL